MFLESLLVHAPHSKTLKELPWVDPWVITNELLVLHEQGIKNHRMAHELALLWKYSFAENNLNYVQDHPTSFLQMYAALEQKNEHPLKDANHFDNPLLNTKWHHVFLLGCLRHAFEHRINVKEYEGLKPLTSIVHAQLVELYSMFANPETKASFQSWMREYSNFEPVLQQCFLQDLNLKRSLVSTGGDQELVWAHYEGLTLTEPIRKSLFTNLLLDIALNTQHFTPMVRQYFPEVVLQFNTWLSVVRSLSSDLAFDQGLKTTHSYGDHIHTGLSDAAYEWLETIPTIEASPLVELNPLDNSNLFAS